MYLNLLKEIMLPPECPICSGTEEMFDEINKKLGVILPEDYRRFIMTYGEGNICSEWCIFSPFSDELKLNDFNLLKQVNTMGEAYLYLKKQDEEREGFSSRKKYVDSCYNYKSSFETLFLERNYSGCGYPFEFYPEPSGLFPFGRNYSGYEFYWKMKENEKWSIVVYPDTSCFYEYDMSMTEFIYKVITGQIKCDGLSEIVYEGVYFQQFKHTC